VIASTSMSGMGGLTTDYGTPNQLIPAFFGVGYEVVSVALLGNTTLIVGLILLFLKLIATTLTLGSGGSGGTFAPALFLGAMLGVVFGHAVNALFPNITAPAGAYALVGMAAVLAGTAHAPATSILLLFELTRDYNIILPLMLATVISVLISKTIQPQSSYTIKLARRGIHLQQGRDVDLMESVTVAEAMERNYESVPPDLPVTELATAFERTHHHGFPVVTTDGTLVGVVTVSDLKRALDENHNFEQRKVKDIATTHDTLVAYPSESLATAMLRLGVRGVGRLPVVSQDQPPRFLGMLRRENIIRAYNQAMARRTNVSHRLRTLQRKGMENLNVLEIKVEDGMSCEGKTISELAKELPENCIVASIRRRGRILIPHGNTVLQPGDQLTVLATLEHTAAARDVFC
jgi:CIC family chloride channel protein